MFRRISQMLRTVFHALLVLEVAGCYRTTVHSGAQSAPANIEYDAKWHHGLVWGIAELSGPYNLAHVCPQGWASIRTETSFLNGLTSAVTSGVYSPQTVTVRCSVPEPSTLPNLPPRRELERPPGSQALSRSH